VHPQDDTPNLATRGPRRVLKPDVATALRAARKRRGESAAVVARVVGVSRAHVLRLEQGERCPSTVVARALADHLRLDPDAADALMAEAVPDAGRSRTLWAAP
jgi:transcriptional regulator with XRE-family HTH domain